MAALPVQRFFNGSCKPIKYQCEINTNYIDPCSCTSHYQCVSDTSIILRPCAQGTGYDHEQKACNRSLTDIVINELCDQNHPWERCLEDYDDVDEDALWRRCKNITLPTTTPPEEEEEGVDGGLVAGVVIAVLLIVVIAVVIIVYVRKRGNPLRHLTGSRGDKTGSRGDRADNQPSSSASTYKTGPGEEETYAEIEDTALYKASGGMPLSQTQSHSNETYDRDIEEGVSYDNPALQRDTPPLPDRDSNLTPPEYSPLEEKEQAIRSYSSLYEHRANAAADERNSKEPFTGDDGYLVAEAIGQSNRSSDPADPNYFVLENENS